MYRKVDLPRPLSPQAKKRKIPEKLMDPCAIVLHCKLFTQLTKADNQAPAPQLLEPGLLSQMHYFDGHFLCFPLMKAQYLPIVLHLLLSTEIHF